MFLKNKYLGINSVLIALSSSIIATILHEFGHYVVAIYLNLNPELHHNYVIPLTEVSQKSQILMAAAGPLFSLMIGILVLYASIKWIKFSLLKLFFLWLGLQNILMFLGYMLVAPIAKDGDTGMVFDYLGIPMFLSISIAISFFIFVNFLFSKFSNQFVFYKNEDLFNIQENSKQLFLWPILSSIVMMTILSFPIYSWVSILPSVFMPMTYFTTMERYKKLKFTNAQVTISNLSVPLVILTIISIMLFRFLV